MFGFGKKAADFYDEGYNDGQQYAEEYPDLDPPTIARAQKSAQAMNSELGLNETQDAQWQSGFVDGYRGEEYGESHMHSLAEYSDEPQPQGFSWRRLIGF